MNPTNGTEIVEDLTETIKRERPSVEKVIISFPGENAPFDVQAIFNESAARVPEFCAEEEQAILFTIIGYLSVKTASWSKPVLPEFREALAGSDFFIV